MGYALALFRLLFSHLNDLDMTAEELLAKFAAGEREFAKADLREAELRGANLEDAIGV